MKTTRFALPRSSLVTLGSPKASVGALEWAVSHVIFHALQLLYYSGTSITLSKHSQAEYLRYGQLLLFSTFRVTLGSSKAFDDRVSSIALDEVLRALRHPYHVGVPFSYPKISRARYHENSQFSGIQTCSDHQQLVMNEPLDLR